MGRGGPLLRSLQAGALTAAAGLAALTVLPSALAGASPGAVLLALPAGLLTATAAGGAVAVRRGLAWPDVAAGALLGSTAACVATWLLVPGAGPAALGDYPGALRAALLQGLIVVVTGAAGIFALPLLDPRVRRSGPAPDRRKLLALSAAAALVLLGLDILRAPGGYVGLFTLAAGSVAAAALAAGGLLLSLARRPALGAAAGGLALLLWAAVSVLWLAAGAPWFP